MSNRHLPAGQAAAAAPGGGAGGGAGPPGLDMGAAPGPVPGPGPAPRRGNRAPSQYQGHYHPQPVHNPMYANYHMTPYGNAYGYPPMHMSPHNYQNGAMPAPGYMPYPPPPFSRSPPGMQQYPPMVVQSSMAQHSYSRPPPAQSPVISTPYQPPPPPPVRPPHVQEPVPRPIATPSSTRSTVYGVPTPMTPPTPQNTEPLEIAQRPPSQPQSERLSSPPAVERPFRPPLPWYSRPDLPWPAKKSKSKRRRRISGHFTTVQAVQTESPVPTAHTETATSRQAKETETRSVGAQTSPTPKVSLVAPVAAQAPTASRTGPSEQATTAPPKTPNAVQAATASPVATPTPTQPWKPASRATAPALPVVPVVPKTSPKTARSAPTEKPQAAVKSSEKPGAAAKEEGAGATAGANGVTPKEEVKNEDKPAPAPRATPKNWAALFAKSQAASPSQAENSRVNGAGSAHSANAEAVSFARSNANSLAEALRAYQVGSGEKIAFVEPRGLVNTGNMCYMNSILQVLLFCVPFYDFLDQAGKKAAFSFKSETPLIDAMIEFLREFKIITSAVSPAQLRMRIKNEEYEQYGEPFTPEFVYGAIRKLPRFASMQRGHQQDAEEFLGFLLQSLHDECAHAMGAAPSSSTSTAANSALTTPTSATANEGADSSGAWLEVGRRQRPAVTRSSGQTNISSPLTKIFGGQLRSELRVPGLKDSVVLEPYQPLQLDIGAPDIRNIVDALKGLTRPETIRGDFNSPRGKDVTATKQVFIESLPPVLILHLKRFQFDAEGNGTVKIWKKVGYPLELDIPREVLSRHKRNSNEQHKYRLAAVVYHHGKNASGGHYTVDVRRQDGREWIRLDDTVIRRIRSEDVAEGGAEEDPAKISEAAAKKEAAPIGAGGNRFAGMDADDAGDGEEGGWKEVNSALANGKKWSSVVNGGASSSGASTPKGKPAPRDGGNRDNKVAYLLFYQRF